MFRDALKSMLERDLRCPKCGEENSPGRPPKITIENLLTAERAGCDTCGHDGPLKTFQR